MAQFLQRLRPERERLFDYYRGQQPIPKGEAVRGRPNNLLRAPFPRYITEVHTGYFLGLPPTLDFEDQRAARVFSQLSCILSSKNPWFCQSKFLGIATGIPW